MFQPVGGMGRSARRLRGARAVDRYNAKVSQFTRTRAVVSATLRDSSAVESPDSQRGWASERSVSIWARSMNVCGRTDGQGDRRGSLTERTQKWGAVQTPLREEDA